MIILIHYEDKKGTLKVPEHKPTCHTLVARGYYYYYYYFLIFFFASEAREQRGEAGSTRREASRLPSEPAKRLIFSPTMRQRASGTRVNMSSNGCRNYFQVRHDVN